MWWRFLLLLIAFGVLGLVIRNVVRLVRGYRPPRKALPPKKPEIEDADFKEM